MKKKSTQCQDNQACGCICSMGWLQGEEGSQGCACIEACYNHPGHMQGRCSRMDHRSDLFWMSHIFWYDIKLFTI